jgi:hypothetical protein
MLELDQLVASWDWPGDIYLAALHAFYENHTPSDRRIFAKVLSGTVKTAQRAMHVGAVIHGEYSVCHIFEDVLPQHLRLIIPGLSSIMFVDEAGIVALFPRVSQPDDT